MVDPGCSGGGFDDVQDLHEQRVVMTRTLNALKTIPQKGALRRGERWEQSLLKAPAGGIEDDWRGYKSDAGSVGKLVDNWRGWCYILGD